MGADGLVSIEDEREELGQDDGGRNGYWRIDWLRRYLRDQVGESIAPLTVCLGGSCEGDIVGELDGGCWCCGGEGLLVDDNG